MRYLVVLCILSLFSGLTGCRQESIPASFKSENTFENGVMQSTPNFAQFREIPIPENATMSLDKTLLFGNDPLVGRLAFKVPYNQANMFDFYMQEMPKFGWRELTSIRATNSYLTYAKDNRVAMIQLTSTSLNGTEVIFDVSMTKNNSSSKGYY
ncbi:MAG: hypothetical protein IJC11_02740 [Alphaproteobacteria bacterium]|nr:hypothetical protein [Alphaproteobacteria bacterium]MBQ3117223.1 hypothetical protein [Alphaproteobacteria bacterium]MBQ6854495.1 hypothetical protein [Alphaproteobacteria bacterium]MBR3913068.1 hypothetical protein [Alphaproteobacteria bacterium]MBR4931413.1 hypothetical protein [Alphaproteobacteria bacterium]